MFKKIKDTITLVKQASKAAKRANYPKTVAEILDDDIQYRKSTLEAVIKFKKARPWRGTSEERQNKIFELNRDLAKSYKINEPIVVFPIRTKAGSSAYMGAWDIIVMESHNVVTFLHEFGHALGFDERKTCWWSINLFRKCFPKQYAKLIPRGHLLYKAETLVALDEANEPKPTKDNKPKPTDKSIPKGK